MSDKSKYQGYKGKQGDRSASKKPTKSRNRPQNRYESEATDPVGTSAKKLKLSENVRDIEVDTSFGYRLINFVCVFSAISSVVKCKVCNSDVTFTESSIRGLGFKIVVSCKKCPQTQIPNSPLIDNRAYDINRRIIVAIRLLGVGLHGIKKFCAFMELPRPIFHSFYDKVITIICEATQRVCAKSMRNAVKIEKEENARKGLSTELIVSGDGSWRKRGFSSLFGLVSLIGWNSGKVIDILIKSSYCKACEFWNKKAKATNTLDDYSHKSHLPELVFKAIKPIYEELSRDDLLNRCLGGFTQNNNESFNATVWAIAPKCISSGKTVLDIAGNLAVCTFNDGISSVMEVIRQLGMTVGTNCYNFCIEADEQRIDFSERSLTKAAKTARMASKSTRKEDEELNINLEGQLYGAGIAD
ncbi:hypothetical protein ALC62_02423 [Cyphomyrmex costatus]|uniref:Mutator-like transposase domain-containing protein n=1 Tax=Cyphomyrmex costatus TaxID=456900 RepID=A0A151IN27_9HYME|nr:hypothetical protein ALC62_02423 [Cyphomyrmex costatus]